VPAMNLLLLVMSIATFILFGVLLLSFLYLFIRFTVSIIRLLLAKLDDLVGEITTGTNVISGKTEESDPKPIEPIKKELIKKILNPETIKLVTAVIGLLTVLFSVILVILKIKP
jgi:hypothetical protein